MSDERKDEKQGTSGPFQRFEELTKNLLAVSNKEAREQDAVNKRKRKEEERRGD